MSEFNYKQSRPARSRLFSLEPIGIGTAGVESLESYTCRLARRHDVARHSIEQLVNHDGEALYEDLSGPPRLDSPTEPALRFGERLAALTMRPDVAGIGLGRFANQMSTMHTLRKYRAWCGDCICDARDASMPAHLPLLWSLAEYQRCLIHGQVLETQCSACNKRSVASNSWSRSIDHCPWCDTDLAKRRNGLTPSFAHLARRGEVEIDLFCSGVLGELVAQASTASERATRCDVDAVIRSAVTRGVATSPAALATRAGLSKTTLHTVMRRNRPSLIVLLRLAAAADVSLAGIFYPRFWREGVRGPAPAALSELPRLRSSRQHDWEQIRRDAQNALSRGEAVSLQRLARELGVDQSYLAERIGDIRHAILERGCEARKGERIARLAELTETVRQTRKSLIEQGTRVTARAIGKALNCPTGSPYMRQALKLARS